MTWDGSERRKENNVMQQLSHISTQLAVMNNNLEIITKTMKQHDSFINGNGHKGAKSRIDELESAKKSSENTRFVAWSAVVTIVLKSAWDLITHGGSK